MSDAFKKILAAEDAQPYRTDFDANGVDLRTTSGFSGWVVKGIGVRLECNDRNHAYTVAAAMNAAYTYGRMKLLEEQHELA